ncbi:MAG: hypothetical protein ACRDWT_02665 [Jatrophihabitantaceae bacterium]
MSHPLRALAAAALGTITVAAGLLTVAVAPAGGAESRPGYTLEHAHLIGETPAGFHVYVDARAAQRTELARASRHIIAELRRLGLRVVYAGYGNPAPADGRIEVAEGSYGCATRTEARTAAVTVSYYGAAAGPDVYMSHSAITLCPSFARYASAVSLSSALKHEFGHAMGLGHTGYSYLGRHQIMYPALQSNVSDYQAGDIRGLRAMAAGAARVRNELPPVGRQASSYRDGDIVISGWTLLRSYPGHPVTITVTDNGRTVYRSASTVPDSAADRAYHVSGNHGFTVRRPWPGGSHRYCVSATSSVNSRATASLGCVTWRG